MVSSSLLFALTIPAPFLFVVGFFVGKQHVRHLAKHGGEEGYPAPVRTVVEKYRQERRPEVNDD